MKKQIRYGSKQIDYTLRFVNRKTLGITVTPEMNVVVNAPTHASIMQVQRLVRKRAPWILKQQSYFLSFQPTVPKRNFVSGETHFFQGKEFILKVLQGKKESVGLNGKYIQVVCQRKQRARLLMSHWYRENAEIKFDFYLRKWLKRLRHYDIRPQSVTVRSMKKRWGSCTPSGKILLNPDLIKATPSCIEYVIAHELCHLKIASHNRRFYDFLGSVLPDWQKRKRMLERVA